MRITFAFWGVYYFVRRVVGPLITRQAPPRTKDEAIAQWLRWEDPRVVQAVADRLVNKAGLGVRALTQSSTTASSPRSNRTIPLCFGIAAIAGLAVVLFIMGALFITSGSIWTFIVAVGLLSGMLLVLHLTVGLDVTRRSARQADILLAKANAAREEDERWLEAIKRDFPRAR